MRRILILAAAVLAACLFFVPSAHADCGSGEGDCPLEPPQSEEVSPEAGRAADLTEGGIALPGSAVPVVAAMPLPRTVAAWEPEEGDTPAPADVEQLPVPMRYQNPGDASDVSCGIQALGMALDGLGGVGPTSAAISGVLGKAGMLYEYGTGVEELAFAAQSLGYAGSMPIHGATLDDLRTQLDLGQPVVVALGVNGEDTPGHFVTVTGISDDGAWVSVNDPALGPQTLPASDFMRLWGLQGNSGVVVAKEPPAAADGSPIDLMPWVAMMAGVMALASTTPWGAKRPGVGGRVDGGGGGGRRKAPPARAPVPRPAPLPAARPMPRPAPPAPPPASVRSYSPPAPRARLDSEPPAPPPVARRPRFDTVPDARPRPRATPIVTPTPAPTATPTPISPQWTPTMTPRPTPRARFDEERMPGPIPTARPLGRGPVATPRDRFDEEGPPLPRVPAGAARPISGPRGTSSPGARFDEEPLPSAPRPVRPVATPVACDARGTPGPGRPRFDGEGLQVTGARGPWVAPGSAKAPRDEAGDDVDDRGWVTPRSLGTALGWGNRLLGTGRRLNAASKISILEVDDMLRVFGPRSARETLGLRPTVNVVKPGNEGLILKPAGSQALGALSSPTMPIGLATNIIVDGARYLTGEYNNTELAAALTVDTGATIATGLIAGAVAGLVSGALVGGALGFGVGAVPAAIAGGIAGTLGAFALSSYFESSGVREYVVGAVEEMYEDWT